VRKIICLISASSAFSERYFAAPSTWSVASVGKREQHAAIEDAHAAKGKLAQQIGGEFNINPNPRELTTAELVGYLASHRATGRDEQPGSKPPH
jgi:hypothetical protein